MLGYLPNHELQILLSLVLLSQNLKNARLFIFKSCLPVYFDRISTNGHLLRPRWRTGNTGIALETPSHDLKVTLQSREVEYFWLLFFGHVFITSQWLHHQKQSFTRRTWICRKAQTAGKIIENSRKIEVLSILVFQIFILPDL